jgi:hypothetical protein
MTDERAVREPRTEAGKALLEALIGLGVDNDEGEGLDAILAIENEAAAGVGLDVDAIEALISEHNMLHDGRCDCGDHEDWPVVKTFNRHVAEAVSAMYAAETVAARFGSEPSASSETGRTRSATSAAVAGSTCHGLRWRSSSWR